MKWIRRVLLKKPSGHDSDGQKDGRTRCNLYTPLSNSLKRGWGGVGVGVGVGGWVGGYDKCGIKLLIHFHISMAAPLKFEYGIFIPHITGHVITYPCNYLSKLSHVNYSHLPLVPHIYASMNRVSIGSDNGLSPKRRKAII